MKIHKQFIQIGITNTLLTLVVAYALYYHNFHMAFVGALMLLVSVLPVYLKAAYNIFVPAAFMYAMIIFIFISVFFGQFNGMYDRWHWSDSVLHFISALGFGLIGFLLLYVYYVHNKLRIPKGLILFFAFFFCLGVGGLWEIIEYSIDHTFGTNMQVNSLDDTMTDLILDGCGGLVSIVICSLYMSKRNVPIIDTALHALTVKVIAENKEFAKTSINDASLPETNYQEK